MAETIKFPGYPFDLIRLDVQHPHGIACHVDHTIHEPELVRLVRGADRKYSMKRGNPDWVGGNITWFDAKGNVLSWQGPFGRACPPRLLTEVPFNYWVYDIDIPNYTNLKLIRPGGTPVAWATRMLRRFSGEIWRNGKLYAIAPTHWVVLGAATTTAGGVDYLVAVVTRSEFGIVGSYTSVWQQSNPEILYDRVLYVKTADLPAAPTGTNVPWVEAAQETYAAHPGVLPRIGCYAFNRSGNRAASLIPMDGYPDDRELRNDLISRITIAPTPDGLSATFVLQPQAETQIIDTIVETGNIDQVPEGTQEYDMATWNTSATFSGSVSGAASAVVAIDYDGDTEIIATATFAYSGSGGGSSHNSGANGAFLSYAESVAKNQSRSLTLTLGATPVVLLDQSYSDDWNYANNGESGGVSRTETALTGIDRLHFAYLDIRNAVAVTWKEAASVVENRSYAATYSNGTWTNTGAYTLTSSLAYEIDIGQSAAYAGTDTPEKNTTGTGAGVDFRVGGKVPPTTTTSVRNISIPNLFRQDLIPNFATEVSGFYIFDLPSMRIAGDKEGAVAASMYERRYLPTCYSLETSAPYTPIITALEKAIDLVGFSGGDIDAIYAAYQAQQYPPNPNNPDDPNNTVNTAIASTMTPRFTV
ncbi:hypothetical protein [Methylococcus mesophilus]|uniref:hypothetical protein n=1 Tax=Methylococcus mesophilus TaxID=2993564 RepID=UPI00224A91A5|nr:hypothetical protein [Methylococcus mesophilus]UZR29097.1 hypothetical protein OOT43_00290 [Methylococcus mesophilus]